MERKTGIVVHVVKDKGYWSFSSKVAEFSARVELVGVGISSGQGPVSFELGPARQTNFQHQAVNGSTFG